MLDRHLRGPGEGVRIRPGGGGGAGVAGSAVLPGSLGWPAGPALPAVPRHPAPAGRTKRRTARAEGPGTGAAGTRAGRSSMPDTSNGSGSCRPRGISRGGRRMRQHPAAPGHFWLPSAGPRAWRGRPKRSAKPAPEHRPLRSSARCSRWTMEKTSGRLSLEPGPFLSRRSSVAWARWTGRAMKATRPRSAPPLEGEDVRAGLGEVAPRELHHLAARSPRAVGQVAPALVGVGGRVLEDVDELEPLAESAARSRRPRRHGAQPGRPSRNSSVSSSPTMPATM